MYTFRVHTPTAQYGYVEVDVESAEKAKEMHDEITRAFTSQSGLSDKEWRDCLDRYLTENKMDSNQHSAMNETQKHIINEIKKSFIRIGSKDRPNIA